MVVFAPTSVVSAVPGLSRPPAIGKAEFQSGIEFFKFRHHDIVPYMA